MAHLDLVVAECEAGLRSRAGVPRAFNEAVEARMNELTTLVREDRDPVRMTSWNAEIDALANVAAQWRRHPKLID